MTDMQVRARANEIAEMQAEAARTQALAAKRQAQVAARRAAEERRSHIANETLQDLENQVKYGYDSYMPITEEGNFRRQSAWGVGQIPFDWIKNKLGGIIGSISPLGKLLG